MIIIKKILFKLLDEIEPNELLEIKIGNSYPGVYVANNKSIMPLAYEMKRIHARTDIEFAYRDFYQDRERSTYEIQYEKDHMVQLDGKDYMIVGEILDIEYKDDYFCVTMANPYEIATHYYLYNEISAIKKVHESPESTIKYNKINYNLKTNK